MRISTRGEQLPTTHDHTRVGSSVSDVFISRPQSKVLTSTSQTAPMFEFSHTNYNSVCFCVCNI